MAHDKGIITAPIDVLGDVATVLGVNSGDVGYLCSNQHDQIKKWAKYKPVRLSSPDNVMAGNLPDDTWYRGDDGKCGLQINWEPGIGVKNAINGYKNGDYKYLPPIPGTHWCRITDFNGYNHNAQPFFATGIPKGQVYVVNLQIESSLKISTTYSTADGQLSIDDFDNIGLSLKYAPKLVAMVYNKDPFSSDLNITTNKLKDVVSTTTIDKSPTITIPFTKTDMNKADDYWVMLCALTTVDGGSRFYTLPFDDKNYPIFKVHLTDEYAISVKSLISWNGYKGTIDNPIPLTSSELGIALYLINKYSSDVEISKTSRFQIRCSVSGGIGDFEMDGHTKLSANSENGQGSFYSAAAITAIKNGFSSSTPQSNLYQNIRIQIKDTTGATKSWQTIYEQQVYFKR